LIDLLKAALDDPRISRITLFCTPPEKRLFKMPSSGKLTEAPRPWIDKNYALRIVWYDWLLGFECRQIGVEVLLNSTNFGRGGIGTPHVTYVQQSLPFSQEALKTLPMTDRFAKRIQRLEMMRSCRSAACVVCQSSIMTNWLTEAFHLDPAKVATIYSAPKQLGSPPDRSFSSEHGVQLVNKGHLLYVGSDYRYKKLETAVAGLEILRRRIATAELTMTLEPNHPYHLRKGVNCVGYLDDEKLSEAYKSADILVLPSLVESGPQPPIEAMSLGTPVLIADRPYAHDICGGTALFFDPNSPDDFAEKAIRLLTDEALRQSLIDKGLKLVQKRRAERPYKKIIDIAVECAQEKP
jgi:glycosyltransferase involved in cell wall biosynthesis